ncbi:hypothetical protein CEXT_616421 [Caerostris extrusa]|uniref:Uncharacterized protein n=1 Tax=Caerostris extrusa TaxID=172846 RepID=A0AAV4SYU8_CAEEX|nr:hypothetical protein CEXT_616421 [Caerostris extrusa]
MAFRNMNDLQNAFPTDHPHCVEPLTVDSLSVRRKAYQYALSSNLIERQWSETDNFRPKITQHPHLDQAIEWIATSKRFSGSHDIDSRYVNRYP